MHDGGTFARAQVCEAVKSCQEFLRGSVKNSRFLTDPLVWIGDIPLTLCSRQEGSLRAFSGPGGRQQPGDGASGSQNQHATDESAGYQLTCGNLDGQ